MWSFRQIFFSMKARDWYPLFTNYASLAKSLSLSFMRQILLLILWLFIFLENFFLWYHCEKLFLCTKFLLISTTSAVLCDLKLLVATAEPTSLASNCTHSKWTTAASPPDVHLFLSFDWFRGVIDVGNHEIMLLG